MNTDAVSGQQVFRGNQDYVERIRSLLRISGPDSRTALHILSASALMAVLTDMLFNQALIGVNAAIWYCALVLCVAACSAATGRRIGLNRWVLFGLSLGFTTLASIRAAPWLQMVDLAAGGAFMLLGLTLPRASRLRQIGPVPVLLALAAGATSLALAAYSTRKAMPWDGAVAASGRESIARVARALLVAVPVLAVFGGLFIAADAVFAAKARSLLSIRAEDLNTHFLYLFAGFWTAAAAIWSAVAVYLPDDAHAELADERRPGSVEVGAFLLPLVLLFLAFVLVQVQYLFGGKEAVEQSSISRIRNTRDAASSSS